MPAYACSFITVAYICGVSFKIHHELKNECKVSKDVQCRECSAHQDFQSATEWVTKRHDKGWCAMYGVCADRLDGGSLNCPANIPAPPADKQAADILLSLCPDLWASSGTLNDLVFPASSVEVASSSIEAAATQLHAQMHHAS